MSVQVGNKKITDQNRNSSTLWQGSMINSTEGSVNANAAKDINVNGSMIYANKDINMSGDTVNFNTVQNIVKGDQKHKDSFTGLTAGVDTKSVAGGMAGLGLAAANSTSKTTILTDGIKAGYAGIDTGLGKAEIKDQAIKGNMTPQEIDKINKANKNNSSAANYNLVGAYASIGHSSNKSHLTTESTRDTGSVVSAGGKVSINAKNDINATAATINGNDVIFNAGRDINLNAGHATDKAKRKTSSKSFGVGVTADIGMGGGSAMINANMALSGSNMHSSSTTAIDTIVNGQHSVIINNKKRQPEFKWCAYHQ